MSAAATGGRLAVTGCDGRLCVPRSSGLCSTWIRSALDTASGRTAAAAAGSTTGDEPLPAALALPAALLPGPPLVSGRGAVWPSTARFELAAITNCDDDLFAASARRLGVAFDHVITAQQAGSYKPSHHNFELAFERIGRPRDRILHVAQSLYHDHVPARQLGLASVWIDRRHGRPGSGATPPVDVTPDLAVPDMATFAALAAP